MLIYGKIAKGTSKAIETTTGKRNSSYDNDNNNNNNNNCQRASRAKTLGWRGGRE